MNNIIERIDNLLYAYNPYEYIDYYEEKGKGKDDIAKIIISNPESIIDGLNEVLGCGDNNFVEEAQEILKEMCY